MVVQEIPRESSTRSLSDMYDCQMVVGAISYSDAEEQSTPYPNRKRVRTRRVMIDESQNKHIPVLSLEDYSSQELHSTFYSREEYMGMRNNIKHTIRFLKFRKVPPASANLNFQDEKDLCLRGLECLADEYVNMHRKRTRELSMAAVFACQNMMMMEMQSPASIYDAEAVAQAYQFHTLRAQTIAGRWGHFDALDAGT